MIHVRGTPAKSTPDGVYLRAGRTERSLFCFTDATSNDGVCNGRACDENPIRAMMSAISPAKAPWTKRVSFSLVHISLRRFVDRAFGRSRWQFGALFRSHHFKEAHEHSGVCFFELCACLGDPIDLRQQVRFARRGQILSPQRLKHDFFFA